MAHMPSGARLLPLHISEPSSLALFRRQWKAVPSTGNQHQQKMADRLIGTQSWFPCHAPPPPVSQPTAAIHVDGAGSAERVRR